LWLLFRRDRRPVRKFSVSTRLAGAIRAPCRPGDQRGELIEHLNNANIVRLFELLAAGSSRVRVARPPSGCESELPLPDGLRHPQRRRAVHLSEGVGRPPRLSAGASPRLQPPRGDRAGPGPVPCPIPLGASTPEADRGLSAGHSGSRRATRRDRREPAVTRRRIEATRAYREALDATTIAARCSRWRRIAYPQLGPIATVCHLAADDAHASDSRRGRRAESLYDSRRVGAARQRLERTSPSRPSVIEMRAGCATATRNTLRRGSRGDRGADRDRSGPRRPFARLELAIKLARLHGNAPGAHGRPGQPSSGSALLGAPRPPGTPHLRAPSQPLVLLGP